MGGTLTSEELRVLIEEAAKRQARRKGSSGNSASGRRSASGKYKHGGDQSSSQQSGRRIVDRRGNSGGMQQNEGSGSRPNTKGSCICGDLRHFTINCPERGDEQANNTGGNARQDGRRQKISNYIQRNVVGQPQIVPQEPGIIATALEEAKLVKPSTRAADEVPSEIKGMSASFGSSWWCFDTGSNVHIIGEPDTFVHLEEITSENLSVDVTGVAQSMVVQASGIVTVKIVSIVGGEEVELFIDGVLYVPGATHGLFSMGLALEQGFEVDYDRVTRVYSVYKDDKKVISAHPSQAIWISNTKSGSEYPEREQQDRAIVNSTVTDGVGSLQVRLAHTCAQYLKSWWNVAW